MINKYVLDSCVVAKLFLTEDHREIVLKIFNEADKNNIILLAPSLLLYEVNNCLIKEQLSINNHKKCLSLLYKLKESNKIQIINDSKKLLSKVSEISNLNTDGQGYISSFDATFHSLAILENAIFLTDDKKHFRKVQNIKELSKTIMLLENWK